MNNGWLLLPCEDNCSLKEINVEENKRMDCILKMKKFLFQFGHISFGTIQIFQTNEFFNSDLNSWYLFPLLRAK